MGLWHTSRIDVPTANLARHPLMDLTVFLAVLLAAACHAGWNALLKLDLESLVATTLVAVASGLAALPLVLFLGMPKPEAWPYLLASVAIHTCYYLTLARAYRTGDLGQVYPIARGTAPMLTALLSGMVIGETLPLAAWSGVLLLGSGILLMALRGGRLHGRFDPHAVGFALLTAVSITSYTLVDGTGARVAGAPVLYTAWLFVLSAAVVAVIGTWLRGPELLPAARRTWKLAGCGAVLSVASYAIAIWAMTKAPIALVAALRETSVLFAALFARLLLGEELRPARMVAAGIIMVGALLLRLA